jgi:hypothetical protein
VVEELNVSARKLNRKSWFITERLKARKFSEPRQQGFHNEHLAPNAEGNPCVSRAVSSRGTSDEAGVIAETQELPAGPKGEIVTIAATNPLELLRRHPVVFHSELLHVGYVPAGPQKGADFIDVPADDFQRLAQEGTHRTSDNGGVTLFARPRFAPTLEVIESWNDFRDHGVFRPGCLDDCVNDALFRPGAKRGSKACSARMKRGRMVPIMHSEGTGHEFSAAV